MGHFPFRWKPGKKWFPLVAFDQHPFDLILYAWIGVRYVGVGEFNQFQMFFYFFESEQDPSKDPLLVWLTGGPGCSALSGIMYEIGISFHYNGSYIFQCRLHLFSYA